MLAQLSLSLVIYDAIFFVLHLAMHKLPYLAKMHARHHGHGAIDANITNRMDITERLAIVLVFAHPLTRTLFVFVFVFLFIDNHSGFSFPYSYDKVIPLNLVGGSKCHTQSIISLG